MKIRNYLLTAGLVASSIVSTYFVTTSTAQNAAQPAIAVADNEYQVAAVLYMQKAGEYRALAYQAFNLARMRLDADFDKKNVKNLPKAERKRARAVVVDIDETVLDNSPQQAFSIKNRLPFNLETWYAWGEKREAKAIPGALDFLKYAASKGVRVFYISNRDEVQRQATIDNLKSVGFPDVSNETVMLRQTESGKEARRQTVLQNHRIVMLVGDNLNDLSSAFERKSIADRFAEVDKAREMFGAKFIVLPNAMYGDWESAIYEYGRLNEAQKAEKRNTSLE
ncbi:MAG: 5'-nucleotidase, lipoprotein e(P4) family, partial [Acidobacteriota bacterium]|nr:5'-nucleotidase, lipoprotein e(P4) family [Acidobacteriota bacterium]